MNIYADSSFLVSPYVQDAHKAEFLKRIAKRPAIWITPFHQTEVAHAIYLHVFYKKMKLDAATRAWTEFQDDLRAGVWVPAELPASVWRLSVTLAQKFSPSLGVRALDSLHVACALELSVDRFWTFDQRQARLAEAAGLDTKA